MYSLKMAEDTAETLDSSLNINNFINTLNRTELVKFRNAEKSTRKLSKCESAILFNQVCIDENILPRYTDFRYRAPNARNAHSTTKFRRNMIHNNLNEKLALKTSLKRELDQNKYDFLCVCSHGTANVFLNVLNQLKGNIDRYNKSVVCANSILYITVTSLSRRLENVFITCQIFSYLKPKKKF